MREKENETYPGNLVCVSFDGQMVWLRMSDDNNQRIALKFDVVERLVEYGNEIIERLNRPS